MKKLFLFIFTLFLFSPPTLADDDSMLDYDMKFIDDPFANQKPVTQKQFNEVVNKMQAPNKGLIQKFKEYLGRNKPENDPALKKFQSEGIGELGAKAKDFDNMKPNLILSGAIVDSYGRTIPEGHYQIMLSNQNNTKLINFMQGNKLYGSIKAQNATDSWDKNVIIYARILYPNSNVARVIFSNLDVCVEGYAKILNPI